jgi:hypothetical protein
MMNEAEREEKRQGWVLDDDCERKEDQHKLDMRWQDVGRIVITLQHQLSCFSRCLGYWESMLQLLGS